jgi:hypothetical protein
MPSSVVIFRKHHRGGTMNVSKLVIFTPSPYRSAIPALTPNN